jgi:hypothetical protein
VSVTSNGHRLLVAGIALVSAFQYHFSRMPPPKQGKTKVATKKKSRPGGPRPGAGRPPIQPGRSAVKIRLDSEVISAVDTVAKLRKLDRSRVIEGALRQWLKEDKTAPGV